ncbi:hypothetical protein [Grimontia marina]|uniref:Uncharacterized protein n=1 Tax=Grimontia marina TaxID=646534 RepID=A0A128F8X4_9GAMM|nr:hypothetical protein [Grimontia marina]CZF83229.1 hypothetical protein GMA8713_02535 [Grimontia marina]
MNSPRFRLQCWKGNTQTEVSQHQLAFSENAPGRAQLTIKGDAAPKQIVAIDLGWGDSVKRVFTGYIERVSPGKPGYVQIFCRELAAVLYHPWHVVMRHPTLAGILSNLSQQTGLQFVFPENAYSQTAIPCFYSTGNGYRLLDDLGQAFSIPDYIWQQQGDGSIFVGSWGDSYWADKAVDLPNNIMNPNQALKKATLPCIPHLKPGVVVNGRKLASVEHTGTETVIQWT